MKQKTFYVSNDGKYFETEDDCKLYEENAKADKLRKNIENAKRKLERAEREIQNLKSPWGLDDEYTEPNMENVANCRTLPRIEKICARATVAFKRLLNTPLKLHERARIVGLAGTVLAAAMDHRDVLLGQLADARKLRESAKQKLADLEHFAAYGSRQVVVNAEKSGK